MGQHNLETKSKFIILNGPLSTHVLCLYVRMQAYAHYSVWSGLTCLTVQVSRCLGGRWAVVLSATLLKKHLAPPTVTGNIHRLRLSHKVLYTLLL